MVFLFVQGVSQAHAASYGEDDHTHDGVVCEFVLVAAEEIIVIPPVRVPLPFKSEVQINWTIPVTADRPRSFDSRAPPPRAPPTH